MKKKSYTSNGTLSSKKDTNRISIDSGLKIRIFKSLANPTRFRIISVLRENPLTVGEIVRLSDMEQSLVSHQLRHLEADCFVSKERKGKYVKYKLNNKTISPILEKADKHANSFIFESILNHQHKLGCPACIGIPKMVLNEENTSNIKIKHTCGCHACIENIAGIIKRKSVFMKNHTCGCPACIENQYFLSNFFKQRTYAKKTHSN